MPADKGEKPMRDDEIVELRKEMRAGFDGLHSRMTDFLKEWGSCRIECLGNQRVATEKIKNLEDAVGKDDNGGSGIKGKVSRLEASHQQTRGSMRMLAWVWTALLGIVTAFAAFKDVLFGGGTK